jgi:hypothetical protein
MCGKGEALRRKSNGGLPARMAASLDAALSSRSATIEAADEAANEIGRDRKMTKAGREMVVHGTGRSYGLVLKGRNGFAAAAGVTGAAAARIGQSTNASLPLTVHARLACSNGPRARTVTPDRTARTPKQVSM